MENKKLKDKIEELEGEIALRSPANFDISQMQRSTYGDSKIIEEHKKESKDLQLKIKQKNAKIKVLSIQVTRMEMDLIKVKQELGEALNTIFTNGLKWFNIFFN